MYVMYDATWREDVCLNNPVPPLTELGALGPPGNRRPSRGPSARNTEGNANRDQTLSNNSWMRK